MLFTTYLENILKGTSVLSGYTSELKSNKMLVIIEINGKDW